MWKSVASFLMIAFYPLASPIPESFGRDTEYLNQSSNGIGLTVPKSMIWSANSAVTRKQDVEDDFAMQVSTHLSWEHLLSPAPLSIGLLGDLMIMSSQMRDFPIDGNLPRNGSILYVKYPKSFRTTLVQISNEAQRAFMVAHNNMDKINLLMGNVPSYMKEATEILVTGDEEIISQYISAPMYGINQVAKSSVALSTAVVGQFENVINLIYEVLEMCSNEKTIQETKLDSNFIRQVVLNRTVPSYEQMVSQLNQSLKRDETMMNQAEADMRQALNDMPNGWEMIGMDFVESISNIVSISLRQNPILRTLEAIGSLTSKTQGTDGQDLREVSSPASESSISESADDERCVLKYKNHAFNLYGLARHFSNSYNSLETIDSATRGKYNHAQDTNKLNSILAIIEHCKPLADVVKLGLKFVNRLASVGDYQKPENISKIEIEDLRRKDFFDATETAKEFRLSAENLKDWILSNQQPIGARTPLLSSAQQKSYTSGMASQKMLANCRYRAEMAQATLFAIRQSMEKTRTQMIEQNLEFIKLLNEQQSLKLDEIRYDEIIKGLEEGLKKLSILKEHWTNLVSFFQKISNFVENVANTSIQVFSTHVDTTTRRIKNIQNQFIMDQLYIKALKATQATSIARNMAETYVNVSSLYIMPRISSLSKFVVTDRKFANEERVNLLDQCSADAKAIVDLIIEQKEKIIERIQNRIKTFKTEFSFLDQVRANQIEFLRTQVIAKSRGDDRMKEGTSLIEHRVHTEIDKDEFLRDTYILDDSQQIDATDFR